VVWDDRVVRENDGRKLDHKTLEALRPRAVDQVQQGAHPEDVAAAPGLHRKTVYGWLKTYRDGGRGALLARVACQNSCTSSNLGFYPRSSCSFASPICS
jgi:hypothetical protein